MKTYFLLFLIALATTGCLKDQRCVTKKDNPNCICTMEYDPVCGCDGITYGNACSANCSGVTDYTQGACKD